MSGGERKQHSQLESFIPSEEPEQGGVARRKTLIEEIRAEVGAEQVLLVDAGDFFQGTIFYNAWKGSADIMALNDLGYDVVTLGNHEFDLGPEELGRALRGEAVEVAGVSYIPEPIAMPVVSCNLDISNEASLNGLIKKSVVLDKGDGKIGVLGVVTETVAHVSNIGENIDVTGYLESVQQEVDRLRAEGINKIILLSHVGYGIDLQMAPQLAGVDIIVSGHDHPLLLPASSYEAGAPAEFLASRVVGDYPTVTADRNGDPVLIVGAYEWGRILGRRDVTFDGSGVLSEWNGTPVLVDAAVAAEPSLASKVAFYKAPVDAFTQVPIGSTQVAFDGNRTPGVRSQEMPLGNLVADTMLATAATYDSAVAALTNGGGIRAGLPQGEITFGETLAILPFGNRVVTVDVTGAELVEALDNGLTWAYDPATGIARSSGAFPQVAGLEATFCGQTVTDIHDGTPPIAACPGALLSGGVVTGLQIGGAPVDLGATYRVATNDFMASGGDYYLSLESAWSRPGGYCVDTGVLMLDAFVNEFTLNSPVQRDMGGRLTAE